MSYVTPREFAAKMIDAGESKIFMSTKDTLIRAYMAGAILALAAAFAVTITVNTGQFLVGALLFPVGFCTLYLLGFDLLTGVFTLAPLAVFAKRPGCTWGGMLTLFIRAVMCNWMVSTGVVAAMMSTSVSGKVIAMWMPILIFFYMGFEHSIVNMFLFPSGIMLGGQFTWADYFLYNEIPTVIGNLVGGLTFVGAMIYSTHYKTSPQRNAPAPEGLPAE